MAAVRTYVVREEREVKVKAESPVDAVNVAQPVFAQTPETEPIRGVVQSPKTIEVSAREDY